MNGLTTRGRASEPRSAIRNLGSLPFGIDALFDEVFGNRTVEPVADWAPRVETYVKNDTLHIRADLPGIDPSKVDIQVEGDVMTVRGERKEEHQEASYREVVYGRFERRVRVPDGTDPEKITANYTNGVLEIAVPLAKPVTKKVSVNVTNGQSANA
jgi:HSP20 family protein